MRIIAARVPTSPQWRCLRMAACSAVRVPRLNQNGYLPWLQP